MTLRTTRKTVTFARPFSLTGIDGALAAGTYTVETDEELLQDLSFAAYRRTATRIFLPGQPGTTASAEVVGIDPLDLEAALARDGVVEPTANEVRARRILQQVERVVPPSPDERARQSRNLATLLKSLRPR